jgi:putative transposase
LCEFFEELFNEFMVSEREIYLEKEQKDKGNGYYTRELISKLGKLGIEVPRKKMVNLGHIYLEKNTRDIQKILRSF